MESINPVDLVAFLRRRDLRTRTGIWLMPLHLLGQEENEAARLGVEAVDLRSDLLNQLPVGASLFPWTTDDCLQLLDTHSNRRDKGDCILLYNLDLLLARLTHAERLEVWEFSFKGLAHRPSALLLCLPVTASSLLPTGEPYDNWIQAKRVAVSDH